VLAETAVLRLVPALATRKLGISSLSLIFQSFGLYVATLDVLPDSRRHNHDTGGPALCSNSRSRAIRQRLQQRSPNRLRNQLRCPMR
jgi:hypothetical protein